MNERDFANRIKHYLDLGAARVDSRAATRLYEARLKALSHAAIADARVSLTGGSQSSLDDVLPRGRTLIAVIALALAVGGFSYWNALEHAAELAEVDTALLADELPIDAYLDSGFDEWLKHSSEQ